MSLIYQHENVYMSAVKNCFAYSKWQSQKMLQNYFIDICNKSKIMMDCYNNSKIKYC